MKSFNSDPPSTVMISMPAMIVPFERLSPKHYNFTTYQGLDANFEDPFGNPMAHRGKGDAECGPPREHRESEDA